MPTPPVDRPADRVPRRSLRLERLRARLRGWLEILFESHPAWMILFLLATTPLVLPQRIRPEPAVLPAGSVAPVDIVAPDTLEFVDEIATREVREGARAAVRPIYDLDGFIATDAAASARRAFDSWRTVAHGPEGGSALVPGDERGTGRPSPAAVRAREYMGLIGSVRQAEERFLRALGAAYQRRIVGSLTLLPPEGQVTVRDARTGREWDEEARRQTVSLDEARQEAVAASRATGAGPREVAALGPFLQDLVTPNFVLDGALTESRRLDAAARVEPLIVRIPKGKILLRGGERVGESTARTLLAYSDAGVMRRSPLALTGTVLLLGLLVLGMMRYVDVQRKTRRHDRHLFALIVLVTLLALLVDRGFLWLFDHLVDPPALGPSAGPAYRFMVPLATGAMLITLLVGSRAALAYTLFHVPLFGMMTGWDLPLLLYCLIGNLAAVYGVSGYRKRTAPIKAGLILGGINAAAVLALLGLPGTVPPLSVLLFQMSCGLAGGVLVAVLVSFLLPLLESVFNILTDVRLLELSNLNNPLLRRLAVEAPGSYNHSVIVGTLAEAAAEAIGANALFCRVAAYYHDVGKLLKPSYFIENQREGDNRHDRLSPHMSALVIASHVKEGYELAKSYGLPQEVLDIIPQHHGTRKINFFYQKALRSEGAGTGDVQESDFRYPGPKPQSKEAAIFMLSDSIEAAARTLEDPSPARFKGLIRKIVSDVVLDDQLDQSDLTFSDLERAEAAFLRTLSSIYHHRIDYPGFDFDKLQERPFRGSRAHEGPPPPFKKWGR